MFSCALIGTSLCTNIISHDSSKTLGKNSVVFCLFVCLFFNNLLLWSSACSTSTKMIFGAIKTIYLMRMFPFGMYHNEYGFFFFFFFCCCCCSLSVSDKELKYWESEAELETVHITLAAVLLS